MKAYVFAFLLLVFQMSVFAKIFSYESIVPDFLTVFLVFYSFNRDFYTSIKMAFFIGILQDVFSPSFYSMFSKISVVFVVFLLKNRFFFSQFFVRLLMVLSATSVEVFIKSVFIFLTSGYIDVTSVLFSYIILNLITFFVVSLAYEIRQN